MDNRNQDQSDREPLLTPGQGAATGKEYPTQVPLDLELQNDA